MTIEQIQEAWARAQTDPYCRILNEIEAAETQQEAAEALASCRGLLHQLSSEDRKRIKRDIGEIIDGKPVL